MKVLPQPVPPFLPSFRLACSLLPGILALSVLTLSAPLLSAKTFWVAPAASAVSSKDAVSSGNAAAEDGSEAKPFLTLEAARDAARSFVGKEPVEIIVKKGRFFLPQAFTLSAADGGTEDAPVTYRAEEKGSAHLVGAVPLEGSRFVPVTEESVLARLPESVRGKVLELNLAEVGCPKFSQPGQHLMMPVPVPELFVNGSRQKIARWPNEGWATVAKIIDGGSKANSGLASDAANMKRQAEPPRGGTFEYAEDAPRRWDVSKGVWLWGYWCFDWHDDILKVAAIDPEKKQISFLGQSTYGLRQGNPSPRRWRAIHLLEELDVPGEYYVDGEADRLYFFPESGLDLKSARVSLAFRNQPVLSIRNAQHVTLDGFVIEESFTNGINCENASFLTIRNCVVRNTRTLGISAMGGTNNQFLGNLIEFTGTGGLQIFNSGNRQTLEPGHCLVEGNVIHDFAEHRLCYANGLALGGVGHVARHNEIFNAPHQAVSLGGNNMLFELNIVHHVCLTGDDAAACYKGRNPSCRGNVIRWNYWHDIGSPRGHGNAAIYFDDGDGGETVFGNLFVNCGDPGKGSFGTIFCHGGHGNRAENNIFVDCKRPLGSAPWNDQRWKAYLDAPLWQQRLLKEVNIQSDVYLKAYPELEGFLNGAPIAERRNYAFRNVFVRPTMEPTGSWELDASNLTLSHDPGFVDFEHGNLNLREDSEIFRAIPGFKAIPFSEMGPRPTNPK